MIFIDIVQLLDVSRQVGRCALGVPVHNSVAEPLRFPLTKRGPREPKTPVLTLPLRLMQHSGSKPLVRIYEYRKICSNGLV